MADISLTAAMRSNLFSLQQTSSLLEQTQGRLASGLKVNSPLDNPANYFAASSLRLRADDLSGLKDGMGNAIQTIKAASNGVQGIENLLKTAKGIISSARSADAAGRADLGKQYDEVLSQIDQIAKDSDYQGLTLLGSAGSSTTLDVVFDTRTGHSASKLTLTGFSGLHTALGTAGGNGVTSVTGTWSVAAYNSILGSSLTQITKAISYLETNSAKLSANLSIINSRLDFTNSAISTLKEGADKLTLADMNEESANMLALQTRQNLGITSLSLASQANQSILRLF